MGTRKFEKLILSSAKSKDDIVAEALAQIRKYEAKDPANDYICSVIHAYDNGDNAGDQYIVINEKLRVEYGLKSNAVASSHYSSADIKAMIDAVDAKIPLDPAKEALLKEVEAIEADIRAKEAQLPPKEKELRNLKQQKATIEQEIADLNSLIAQARAEGRSTTVLEASKAQREADLAAKNRQISTLEGQINEIKRQIPLLKEQAKNKQTQQEAIKSPELATKAYVDGINTTLTRSINTKANANAVVTLTGNQTVAGVKTFSSPVVVPNATANTHAVNLAQLNTKANWGAIVALTGNQTIAGIKTFSSPIIVPNATDNTHAVNLAQLNTKANANATVNLTGNQTIAGNKTLSGTTTLAATVINGATQLKGAVTATGAITSSGNVTFNTGQVTFNNKAPISTVAPTAANHLVTKDYVDKKAKAYIIETYNNTSTGSWYRVWSDKWCEQGGFAPNTTIRHDTVTLLKPYKDTKYCIYTSHMGGKWEAWWASDETITDVTTNSFKMNTQKNNTATCRNWKTCGYIA
ncbi:hypothetical protein [Campylobacter sp. P091]|uniref:hypothetical protein n=1 Tax=Campylobacter sp. P091 TaxID=1895621 RepID=UPI000A347B9F|nr:hypothetical protein [Campylobacter sp. P091]